MNLQSIGDLIGLLAMAVMGYVLYWLVYIATT